MDAIYARQSVDKKDSISIESQIEFCKYETRGGKYRTYTDKGYSGKNTDRPHFQELLQDIKNGEITRVIVYKLDRISRSILDFAEMMQMFEQYGVEFVSSTEKFDTSTPMGRAMLNICIVFAQLERETIQKRVADAYSSRSKKGFYMGGKIPYGFKIEKIVIDGIKTSRYVIVPEEAEQIAMVFEMYSNPTTSLRDIMNYFNENGIKNLRGSKWCRATLSNIIKNPIYVQADLDIYEFFKNQGVNIINSPADFIGRNACYLYNESGTKAKKDVRLEGHTLVLAPHMGFVPSNVWLAARLKCLNNDKVLKPNKPKNTWLSGKVRCSKCGHAVAAKKNVVRGKVYEYLACRVKQDDGLCEGFKNVKTDIMENIVLQEIKEKLSSFTKLTNEQTNISNPKINDLKIKEKQIDNEIEILMGKLINANDVLMEYINKRIVELDNEKKNIEEELKSLIPKNKTTNYKTITDHVKKWDKLSFEDKRIVLDALIEQILITDEKIEINWKV